MAPGRRTRQSLFALGSLALILTGGSFLLTRSSPGVRQRPAPSGLRAQLLSEGRPGAAALGAALRAAGVSEGLAEDIRPGQTPPAALATERRAVSIAARAFLGAFFAFEIGDLSRRTRGRLQEFASPEFARHLLDAPPVLPPGRRRLPPARRPSVEIALLPDTDGTQRALVTGTARRGGQLEPFSFLFARQGDGWLASGIGE